MRNLKKSLYELGVILFALTAIETSAGAEIDSGAVKKPDAPAAAADEFTYDSKGARDPFAPPGKGKGGIEEIQNLKIDGIISDESGIVAVLSGQAVKKGDKIFDADVKEITNDTVILEYKKERIELKIQRTEDEKQKKEE